VSFITLLREVRQPQITLDAFLEKTQSSMLKIESSKLKKL